MTENGKQLPGEVLTSTWSGEDANAIQAVFIGWAEKEGFGDWLNSHQAVMRNLSRYLAKNAMMKARAK